MQRTILVLYTTIYRTGGDKFARAAATLASEKAREFPGCNVICEAVESKAAFVASSERVRTAGREILEFHFIGHSGVYGIMFGTDKWPEQFSPHEWRQLSIPFAENARFYFHACRTARWFAPFIARTLKVRTFGHWWYTTISLSPRTFVWEALSLSRDPALHVISCPGKKSHGVLASPFKYSGLARAIPMLEFAPSDEEIDTSYDSVAELYDETFADITVRGDEWSWLTAQLGRTEEKRVLDIGCGNGALLQQLSGRIASGTGVDASVNMIAQAKKRCAAQSNLDFATIVGPHLPFPDDSFDVVVSLLSFRYLDWDPMIAEILRVLKPGGRFLVVDMVAAPVELREVPALVEGKVRGITQRVSKARYGTALKRMVTDSRWQTMLKYNPIRSQHEMKWFLESRFPGNGVEILNVGWNSRVIAFDSGPVHVKRVAPTAYP